VYYGTSAGSRVATTTCDQAHNGVIRFRKFAPHHRLTILCTNNVMVVQSEPVPSTGPPLTSTTPPHLLPYSQTAAPNPQNSTSYSLVSVYVPPRTLAMTKVDVCVVAFLPVRWIANHCQPVICGYCAVEGYTLYDIFRS
jgi:hypothetical protein